MLLFLWSCSDSGEPILKGCMDMGACNYNPDASEDDGFCIQPEENYNCDGNCIADLDICGTCGGTVVNTTDCCPDGQVPDCAGVCGGTAEIDCNGDCSGSAVNDDCNVCGGDNSSCVNYSTEIQPLFSSCTGCHGSSGGLSLSSYNSLMTGGNSGAVVTPGDGPGSLLVKKLRGTALLSQMPKNQDPLDDTTINLIETWINEGALDN